MKYRITSVSLLDVNQKLSPGQIKKVIELHNDLIESEREYRTYRNDEEYNSENSEYINDVIKKDNQRLYIVFEELTNDPIGIAITEPFYGRKDLFGIMSVVIDKDQRNKGVGKSLMNYIKDDLKDKGCKELVLFVDFRTPNAVAFYKALGYELTFANATLGIE